MAISYDGHYNLQEIFKANPALIPSPTLYNYDSQRIWAAAMDKIAQPMEDGQRSPFSSKSPSSGHAILLEVIAWMQSLIGHEVDLTPDRAYIDLLRLQGVEITPAEYPIITVTFKRTIDARDSGIDITIPIGTSIQSILESNLKAITIEEGIIRGNDLLVTVKARLNRRGKILEIQANEFTEIPPISYIQEAYNDGTIVSPGKEQETLSEAALRARELAKIPLSLVTYRDYIAYAVLRLGAVKANARRIGDVITVSIYPPEQTEAIAAQFFESKLVDDRLEVIPANIVEISGIISVKVLPHISDQIATNLIKTAFQDKINPPYGNWQETQIEAKIIETIQAIDGVVLIKSYSLLIGNLLLQNYTVNAFDLFTINNSMELQISRS
jgi:hypothetical protein